MAKSEIDVDGLTRMSNPVDDLFTHSLMNILHNGAVVDTRNGKTIRLINLSFSFTATPLVTVRRTAWKNALREFEWFMSGSSNIKDLHEKVRHWWEPWADKKGLIRNNYSKQFRRFKGDEGTIDQVQYMINNLKKDPNSRRNAITTWNTADMASPNTPITNCHGSLIQAFVGADNQVDLAMHQRSADMALGVPHNFIQYWAFMIWLAHKSGRKPGSLFWFGGDCHIYNDHIDMVKKMRKQVEKKRYTYEIPNLVYTPTSEEFKADDFTLDIRYKPIIKESLKMTV